MAEIHPDQSPTYDQAEQADQPPRDCLNCQGTGQRSYPQSRRDPRTGEVLERLAPAIRECGICRGSGVIR